MLRLVQVELLGFKSFPHKTVFDLDRGVTCVVGPNGSGKSNLSDAINFAFGSQSHRELRAQRLSSLIFAGTEQIRPLNVASVTLHFEYTGGKPDAESDAGLGDLSVLEGEDDYAAAPVEPPATLVAELVATDSETAEASRAETVPASPEEPKTKPHKDRTPTIVKLLEDLQPGARLSLTRRVFRDGTAGYYINGEEVRLKDVDEFFNRFNLGRSAVFSINQGEVEQKILASPQELREWLAEATGVALLLQHKLRAQAKLKRTQANLERLEDIRGNTRELVADLAVQRQAAEEHLRLKEKLRSVELNEIRREVEYGQRQQQSAANALEEARQRQEQSSAALETARSAAHEWQAAAAEAEQKLEEAEAAGREAQQRSGQLRQDAALAAQAVEAHTSAAQRAQEDLAHQDAQLEVIAAEIEAAELQRLAARDTLNAAATVATERATSREQEQAALAEVAHQQDRHRAEVLELAAQAARLHNMVESTAKHARQLEGQLGLRETQLAALSARLKDLQEELERERTSTDATAVTLARTRDQLEAVALDLAKLQEQLLVQEHAVASTRRELAEKHERRRTIAELAEPDDATGGFGVLQANAALAPALNRLADATFEVEYRPAFTRLLADAFDAVVGPPQLRRTALKELLDANAEALWLDSTPPPALHSQSLWRQLDAPPEILGALVGYFGDVLLGDDAVHAQSILADAPAVRWVALQDGGALIGRGHAHLGQPSAERALRVAQKSDLAFLDSQTTELRSQLQAAEEVQRGLKLQQAKRQLERDDAAATAAALEAQLHSQLSLHERLERSVQERETEVQFQQQQLEHLRVEHTKLNTELPELMEQHASAQRNQVEAEAVGQELSTQYSGASAALEHARQAEADASASHALAEQQARHLESVLFDLAERRHNLRLRADALRDRIAQHESESVLNGKAAERLAAEAVEVDRGLIQLSQTLEMLRQQRHTFTAQIEGAHEVLEKSAQAASRAEQDVAAAESLRERAIERVASWLDQLREKYSMTLSELQLDPAVTGAADLAATQGAVPQPAAATLDDETTSDGFERQLADPHEAGRYRLREEKLRLALALEELGAVNLLAIEQHAQHLAKLEFLDTQASELERAAHALERLIHDLDHGMEQRYRKALVQIETHFGELFSNLFGGGSARLHFDTPHDLVSSGVEVEVQLPGSRRMPLRSLSGGQRSLIFLALFFAVHSVRSPGFCILDEADAALDDANVGRFVKLIRQFAEREQFVVVTHNKHTMEVADRLVGVVGRPKGVSNLLAVDLKGAHQMVDKRGAA